MQQSLIKNQNILLKAYKNNKLVQVNFKSQQKAGMVNGIIDMQLYLKITDENNIAIPVNDITKVSILS